MQTLVTSQFSINYSHFLLNPVNEVFCLLVWMLYRHIFNLKPSLYLTDENMIQALFGWAFRAAFPSQKPKAQPKGLLFQKQLFFRSSFWKNLKFCFWLSIFRNGWNKEIFYSCFKGEKDKRYILYLFNQTSFGFVTTVFFTAYGPQPTIASPQPQLNQIGPYLIVASCIAL